MAKVKVSIDAGKCIKLAEHVRAHGGVPQDQEDSMSYYFPEPVAPNAWCAIVAINHQTTPVVGIQLRGTLDGRELYGWDFLLQKAIHEASRNQAMFRTTWLCGVTPMILREMYGPTLSQPEIRAGLLNDLGRMLRQNGWESAQEIYLQSEGYILRSDGKGISQVLSTAKAYQDPVKKKLFYFLALMRNQGFWQYQDAVNLSSPVNYHEQRGHFRIGTVKIVDEELRRKIFSRENISDQEDIEIRSTILRAIEFIAQYLDATPSMMHYYFWNHFRNCCGTENTHCNKCSENCKLPQRYRAAERCILSEVCDSAFLSVERMLIQPRIDNTIWQ